MSPVDAPPPPQHLTEKTVRVVQPSGGAGSSTADWTQRIVSFRVVEPAAPWLRLAVERIQQLTALRHGWDSYTAVPVKAHEATQAVAFLLDHAWERLAAPAVVPLSDGGVQLEWHRGGVDVEIAFSASEPGVYYEDSATGASDELPLDEAGTLLISLMPRLAG